MIKKFKLYKKDIIGGNFDELINNIKNIDIKNKIKRIIDKYEKSDKIFVEKIEENRILIKNILEDLTKLLNKLNEDKLKNNNIIKNLQNDNDKKLIVEKNLKYYGLKK